ncbi:MAG TPA: hypothetical protein VFH31_12740 [Pyrinomonadaceae bacterium]|nr:hypothetical protein [Pyrinomonadaceae bacterium]
MSDHMYLCDGPGQLHDERALQASQHAESETEDAARKLMEIVMDLPFLLRGPNHRRSRHAWVDGGVGDARRSVFETTVWGTIRWDRALGHPSNVRHLSDAFSFNHWYLWINVIDTEAEPIVTEKWLELTDVRAWDGPHDEQSYRVSFMMRAVPGLLNRFWPAITSEAQWEPPAPRWASTRPELIWPDSMLPVGAFRIGRNELLVLDEYRIVKRF